MKKVCIISDTHGSLHPKVLGQLYGCDHIIHAGDIGDSFILKELEEIAPVTAVLGNCDDAFLIRGLTRRVRTETIEGVVFAVVHRPTQLARDLSDVAAYYKRNVSGTVPPASGTIPKIIGIHGHTHTSVIKTGTDASPVDLIVCPGSVSFPRDACASFCEIVVDDGEVKKCEIKDLEGEILHEL